jgi:TRAP-type C4-dicarboxylate transport system permease small subunit
MGARVRRWLDLTACVLTVIVAIVVAVMSWRIAGGMFENDTRSVALEIPLGIPYTAFTLGFGLMALFALVRVVALLREK